MNLKDSLDLTPEQSMLLEKQYKGFARNGANLKESDKSELRKIDANYLNFLYSLEKMYWQKPMLLKCIYR